MKLSFLTVLTAVHTLMAAPAPEDTAREKILLERISLLEQRLAALEKRFPAAPPPDPLPPAATATPTTQAAATTQPAPATVETTNSWLKDATLNFNFDGYYAWNTNRPVGRLNLLRAYDTTANNFSLNQTGVVIERAVDPSAGKRWGYRLDLMYGQATETLQGGLANEARPQVYRNVWQAYGTYVLPIGKGLTTDFGKWGSALGPEGNYTKDQINYSRSYFFNFLPFYHMGFRSTYAFNARLSAGYWLVNGVNQTEDFNGSKSQLAQIVSKPLKKLTWTLNYYNGREQREPAIGVRHPQGRFHVIDTYAFWTPTSKLTLGGEFDYIVSRVEPNSPQQRVVGGVGYFRYQLSDKTYFGQRYTRLNDRGGLFSGVTQNLNEVTSTFGIRPAEGFETRLEYRRDFSNTPYFLRRTAGQLSRHQDTFTLGLLWWFGGKTGTW